MKSLIFDAGPIISLTMNGMLGIIEELKKNFDGEFIITPQVKREIIDKPMKIKKYEFEAIQVNDLLERGILKIATKFVLGNKLDVETSRVLKLTNELLRSTNTGDKINLVQEGEASCLAFSNLCKQDNLIVIDERTTRIVVEAPSNLERLMEKKLHTPLEASLNKLKELGKFKVIRSTEVIYIAYKKGLIHLGNNKQVLDSLLYALKFKGTAISSEEIEEIKKIAG